jgi:hypothetical protein
MINSCYNPTMGWFDNVDLNKGQQQKMRLEQEEARRKQEWETFINKDVPFMIKEFVEKAKEATSKGIIKTYPLSQESISKGLWRRKSIIETRGWRIPEIYGSDFHAYSYIDLNGGLWSGINNQTSVGVFLSYLIGDWSSNKTHFDRQIAIEKFSSILVNALTGNISPP